MIIKDYLKKKYPYRKEVDDCLKNVIGFDFTGLDEVEIFEGIKKDLEGKDLWLSYGPVSLQPIKTVADYKLLNDGKIYPSVWLVALANFDGTCSKVSVYLNPFGCSQIIGESIYEEKARKRISKSFSKFMAEKFGVSYVRNRSGYFEKVKDLKIKAAQIEADMKVEEAEAEFKENIFML